MEKNIAVSIIIPVYNCEDYVSDCLNSLINQTLKEIEVICVDDESTDNSLLLLRQFASQDSRIVVKSQSHKGAAAARNFGLQFARGRYLSFLDADDFFEKAMLEACVKTMDKDQSDIAVYIARRYSQKTGKYSDMPWSINDKYCPAESPFCPRDVPRNIFNMFQVSPWNKMFRRAFLKEKKLTFQEIPRANDVAFVLNALAVANKISVIREQFANYRIDTETSLQQTNDRTPLSFWEAFKETRNRLVAAGIYDIYEQSFLNLTLFHIFYNLRSVKTTKAYREILFYIKYYAEKEFGFMGKTLNSYYDLELLSEYCKIKGKVKNITSYISNPSISVVIPILNSQDSIRECIESILEQSLTDLEVICVDAGSTDETLSILSEYQKTDKRINIIHSEKNSLGFQVNIGIRAARGEYLAIVKADDYIMSLAYHDLYQVAKRENAEVLLSDYHFFMGEWMNRKFASKKIIDDNKCYNKLIDPTEDITVFKANCLLWPGLYSLKFIRENDIQMNESAGDSYQDTGFLFLCLALTRRVYFYNKSFYRFRGDNPGSTLYSRDKVYCMCDEYDFIRFRLGKNKELEKRMGTIIAYCRFVKYVSTLERIDVKYKKAFLHKFSDDFKRVRENGELDGSLFSKSQWEQLCRIIEDPENYYNNTSFPPTVFVSPKSDAELVREAVRLRNIRIKKLNKEVQNLNEENEHLNNEKLCLGKENHELKQIMDNLLQEKQDIEKVMGDQCKKLIEENQKLTDELERIRKSRLFFIIEKLG